MKKDYENKLALEKLKIEEKYKENVDFKRQEYVNQLEMELNHVKNHFENKRKEADKFIFSHNDKYMSLNVKNLLNNELLNADLNDYEAELIKLVILNILLKKK